MKIICIGRNYADHAKELNNKVPSKPMIFMKPPSALLVNHKPLYYPAFTKDLHYEAEIVLKITKNGRHVQQEFASKYYNKIALGIDFTARDLQNDLKEKGHPWEIAKGFDGSAALSEFISLKDIEDPNAIEFRLSLNGEDVQIGNTKDLIFKFDYLITYISQFFKLQQGDLIYTGTPAINDKLEGFITTKKEELKLLKCQIK